MMVYQFFRIQNPHEYTPYHVSMITLVGLHSHDFFGVFQVVQIKDFLMLTLRKSTMQR